MGSEVLTTTEAARLLGVSVRTAQLMVEGGSLHSWKTPGGHRRVYRRDVENLLSRDRAAGRQSATVVVVATGDRLGRMQELLAEVGHVSLEPQPSHVGAALTIGQRRPAAVIVDLGSSANEGANLLTALAADARLKDVALIAVKSRSGRGAPELPSRAKVASEAALADMVRALSEGAAVPQALLTLAPDFPIAPNEADRLAAVQRSGLVGTPFEDAFDRVTWLASTGLKSPVALMTVLTPERQWFKSRQGLEMPDTPRGWAFCNHTVLQRDVFEVRDLAQHPAFANNPAVIGAPHFRFYAGAPVYDPDGFALGSICVIDYRPRHLDQTQRRTLRELAAIASDEMALREALAKR